MLAIMICNFYKNHINKDAKFDIVTNSKILQDQYINEFKYIRDFRGKSSYYCDKHDCNVADAAEICTVLKTKYSCSCPYNLAREKWISGDISLTNFHLFNTLALFVPELFHSRNSNVLILDEAHMFEEVFCDFISSKISARILKKYGFSLKEIEVLDKKFQKIKTIDKYIEFAKDEFLTELELKENKFELEIVKHQGNKKMIIELSRYLNHIKQHINGIKSLIKDYEEDPNNWVLDTSTNEKEKMYSGIELIVQPIWGYKYLKEKIFDKYDHVIFMSGTILDRKMFSYINGLDENITTYFESKSPFHVDNRPIFYIKSGKMTWQNKSESFKNQIPYINKILSKYKNDKGIIHTTTYEFTEWIKENIDSDRLIFHDSDNRDEMLEKHKNSEKPTVLVSPSMMSGLDLIDDLARFQILIKIPYPNISSNKIKARQKMSDWYAYKTCCDFIQMYGRTTRSNDDWSHTFVLDSSFSDLLRHNSKYLPRYITNAITELKQKKRY